MIGHCILLSPVPLYLPRLCPNIPHNHYLSQPRHVVWRIPRCCDSFQQQFRIYSISARERISLLGRLLGPPSNASYRSKFRGLQNKDSPRLNPVCWSTLWIWPRSILLYSEHATYREPGIFGIITIQYPSPLWGKVIRSGGMRVPRSKE
jgi:hypothetical protein